MSGNLLHSFGVNKVEKLKRTKIAFGIRNTCDQAQGVLVPLAWHMVTPSEVWTCKTNVMSRLLLPLANPVFGEIYGTYAWVFVPLRILFKDFEKMFGDGSPNEWVNPTEYIIPSMSFVAQGISRSVTSPGAGYDACVSYGGSVNNDGYIISKPGNLANYCWLPSTKAGTGFSDLIKQINIAPMAAYLRAWSDLFRDENYQNEDPDLAKIKAFNPGSSGPRTNLHFNLHYANRFHDYYSSLLPNVQKGSDVLAFSHLITLQDLYTLNQAGQAGAYDIRFGSILGNDIANSYLANDSDGSMVAVNSSIGSSIKIGSTNLGVEISTDQLRSAFALKRAKERNARTGSRYVEALLGTFEAHLPTAVAQRTEYLGGNSFKLNITSVPTTADTNTGKLGAFSATFDGQDVFVKQFNEPGLVMCLGTYRIKHRYAQGIDRSFMKLRRYDFYDPAFAHVSEQPHYAWELNPINSIGVDTVIGFNEPWVEDIRPIDHVCGLMGDVYGAGWNTFKQWTLVDEYASTESPNPAVWLPENRDEVAKRLVGYDSNYPTWVFGTDMFADCTVTGPRPLYTIPGYIDHLIA